MTSKLTRDRLAEISQFGFSSAITPANDFEIKELARMALAAMDSEPVAWMYNNDDRSTPAITVSKKIGQYWVAEFEDVHPLYRHAQPAPVVPDELNTRTANDVMNEHLSWKDYGDAEVFCIAWNACRAAMLNGGKS